VGTTAVAVFAIDLVVTPETMTVAVECSTIVAPGGMTSDGICGVPAGPAMAR
jgi:hypothetical protein